jgi:hypothetical protein
MRHLEKFIKTVIGDRIQRYGQSHILPYPEIWEKKAKKCRENAERARTFINCAMYSICNAKKV